jgi:hypothetical protein
MPGVGGRVGGEDASAGEKQRLCVIAAAARCEERAASRKAKRTGGIKSEHAYPCPLKRCEAS